MRSFSCLIIQKERAEAKLFKEKLKQFFSFFEVINSTSTKSTAFKLLTDHPSDLIFLDMQLFKENEKEWSKKINSLDGEIILNYPAYFEHKQELKEYLYLKHPIVDNQFINTVNNGIQRHFSKKASTGNIASGTAKPVSAKAKKIAIPTKEGYVLKKVEEIVRIESQNRYAVIYFKDNTNYVSSYNLGKYKDMLNGNAFVQSHKSHIVNGEHIIEYHNSGYLVLSNGDRVPISTSQRKRVLSHIRGY